MASSRQQEWFSVHTCIQLATQLWLAIGSHRPASDQWESIRLLMDQKMSGISLVSPRRTTCISYMLSTEMVVANLSHTFCFLYMALAVILYLSAYHIWYDNVITHCVLVTIILLLLLLAYCGSYYIQRIAASSLGVLNLIQEDKSCVWAIILVVHARWSVDMCTN